ncbi:MAG TPA: hypothetical protein VK636_03465 [Gemmatimonadaceae bacterium]|nr:hypothetical protein [Gemmatimonadaceae bacterium]
MTDEVFTFTDDAGLDWAVVDYTGMRDTREPVLLGHPSAEGRAFIPVDRAGPVMIYSLRRVSYRDTERRVLLDQLRFARPVADLRNDREPSPEH